MSAVTITGRLVSADLPENADPEYEGVIHLQAQMGHEETIYKVAVPTGLMDSVMPGLWNERVSVQACLDDTIAMYMMETAGPAGDGEPDGRRDIDGLESSAPTITMAELTEELERVPRGQDDSRKTFIRSDDSQIEITGVSNTTEAVYIVMGTLVEPMDELAMVEIERGYEPPRAPPHPGERGARVGRGEGPGVRPAGGDGPATAGGRRRRRGGYSHGGYPRTGGSETPAGNSRCSCE